MTKKGGLVNGVGFPDGGGTAKGRRRARAPTARRRHGPRQIVASSALKGCEGLLTVVTGRSSLLAGCRAAPNAPAAGVCTAGPKGLSASWHL